MQMNIEKEVLYKDKSKIEGLGIFTKRTYKKGELIYRVPKDDIFKSAKPRCAYVGNKTWVSDNKILNYVNHSCNPNAILGISDALKLISKRSIAPGDEITVDYNQTEKGGEKVECNCKSNNCRGYFLRME